MAGVAFALFVLVALPFIAGYSVRAHISRRRRRRHNQRQPIEHYRPSLQAEAGKAQSAPRAARTG